MGVYLSLPLRWRQITRQSDFENVQKKIYQSTRNVTWSFFNNYDNWQSVGK